MTITYPRQTLYSLGGAFYRAEVHPVHGIAFRKVLNKSSFRLNRSMPSFRYVPPATQRSLEQKDRLIDRGRPPSQMTQNMRAQRDATIAGLPSEYQNMGYSVAHSARETAKRSGGWDADLIAGVQSHTLDHVKQSLTPKPYNLPSNYQPHPAIANIKPHLHQKHWSDFHEAEGTVDHEGDTHTWDFSAGPDWGVTHNQAGDKVRFPHHQLEFRINEAYGKDPNLPKTVASQATKQVGRAMADFLGNLPHGAIVSNYPILDPDERNKGLQRHEGWRARKYKKWGFGDIHQDGNQYAIKVGDRLHPLSKDDLHYLYGR